MKKEREKYSLKHDFLKKKRKIHSNEKNIEVVSILLKIFQSFTTVYNSLHGWRYTYYDIFVNTDADFPDDDPEEDPDWVENEDDEENEIPALEISQIPTSSRYLGAEMPKDHHGRAAPATVLVFVPKARSAAENLEDPGNIFCLFMDDDIIEKNLQTHEWTNLTTERTKKKRKQERPILLLWLYEKWNTRVDWFADSCWRPKIRKTEH